MSLRTETHEEKVVTGKVNELLSFFPIHNCVEEREALLSLLFSLSLEQSIIKSKNSRGIEIEGNRSVSDLC
jgi:hypothetical protein